MTTADLLSSQVHPQKARAIAIARVVFPNFDSRSMLEVSGLLGQIDDVLRGAGSPWLSRKEREAVEQAAKEIGE